MEELTLREQMGLFSESWRSLEKLYEQYAKSVGLSYTALSILEIIYETPESCTQKLICEQTHLPKQSVNVVIKDFWERGYLEMKEIKSDRRNKTIWLTDSGRLYAAGIVDKIANAEEAAMAQLTYEQRQVVIKFSQKIEEKFKECILLH